MDALLTVLLAMVSRPYHAVSRPTVQAWARLGRGYWRWRLRRAGLAPMAGGAPKTLKEMRDELEAKRKHLHDVFAEAGEEFDLEKVKLIEGDTTQKAAGIRALNDELTALGKDYDEARELADIAAKNAADIKAAGEPQTPMIHPAAGGGNGDRPGEAKSIGEMFTESKAFKDWDRDTHKGPAAEIDVEAKTVMSTGAGFAPESVRTGRLVEEALRPVQLIDLIPGGATSQAAVVYMEETTATNAAAEVAESAEGALVSLPESALAYTERSQTVREIGTYIPVTNAQMEDEPQVRGLINNRLPFFLRQRLDLQVIQGNGVAPNIMGTMNVVGIQTQAKGVDPVPDAIYKAMTLVRVTGRSLASAVFLHPNDWQHIRLLRTADGIYIWGSPSEAGPERIWGLPVAQADSLTENTGIVGDYRAHSELVIRRGIILEVSDSHASYFIQGVQAVKATMRACMVHYRPEAFCTVTGI